LKILIAASGILAIATACIVHLKKLPEVMLDQALLEDRKRHTYGDLYYMCRADHFKAQLPELTTYDFQNNPDINSKDSRIMIFGDSFFGNARWGKTIPEIISDSLNTNIYFIYEVNPLNILSNKYVKGTAKVLLLEMIERRVQAVFSNTVSVKKQSAISIARINSILQGEAKDDYYLYLLKEGRITGSIYSRLMSLKFDAFGLISDETPVYRTNPDWLFYYQDVKGTSGFYYEYSDSKISILAENIKKLGQSLYDDYNLKLLFFVIPNKYTLYHKLINNDKYNDFIPRLNSELGKKGVETVNVYDAFKSSEEILYYPTDTHWNEKGMKIALGLILEKIRSLETTR